jgi:glycosyltransferase involved in cell wall biosynthesis
MRIAVLTISYPNISESFVSREVDALVGRGHTVAVFTMRPPSPVLTPITPHRVEEWTDDNVSTFAPDVLYASLGTPAHKRALALGALLHRKVLFRIWAGYDAFCHPNREFYTAAQADPRYQATIVEDEWMRKYVRESIGLDRAVSVIPNGINLVDFRPTGQPRDKGTVVVLAIARFVEKKGLDYLIRAWRQLKHPTAILRLVGYGPEEERLRAYAGNLALNRIEFVPPVQQDVLPSLYRGADIFAAPCIQTKSGDADGIPTTVLEAMACGLPVIASELLSSRQYVEHGINGLLVTPRDEAGLVVALRRLIDEPELRRTMGVNARDAAVRKWNLSLVAVYLETLLEDATPATRWRYGTIALKKRRESYTPERLAQYADIAAESLAVLRVSGRVLDVGCGTGGMRGRLNGTVTSYLGIDVPGIVPEAEGFTAGSAESLPVTGPFDSVLMYSVLQHIEHPDVALAEAARVLDDGGTLAVQMPINDPNPMFLHWWSTDQVLALVESAGFRVTDWRYVRDKFLCLNAMKGE